MKLTLVEIIPKPKIYMSIASFSVKNLNKLQKSSTHSVLEVGRKAHHWGMGTHTHIAQKVGDEEKNSN